MPWIYRQGPEGSYRRGAPVEPERCCAQVSDGERFPRYHQCERKWKLQELYEGKLLSFCKVHAPSAEEARYKKSMEKLRKEIDDSPMIRLKRALDRIKVLRDALLAAGVTQAILDRIDPPDAA